MTNKSKTKRGKTFIHINNFVFHWSELHSYIHIFLHIQIHTMYMQTYIDGWFWTNWEICMLQQRTKRICPFSIWKTSKQIKYTTQLLQINKENQSSDCCALSLSWKAKRENKDKTKPVVIFFCIVSVPCRISENNDIVLHSTPLNTHTYVYLTSI